MSIVTKIKVALEYSHSMNNYKTVSTLAHHRKELEKKMYSSSAFEYKNWIIFAVSASRSFFEYEYQKDLLSFYCCVHNPTTRTAINLWEVVSNQSELLSVIKTADERSKEFRKAESKLVQMICAKIGEAVTKGNTVSGYTDDEIFAEKWCGSTNPLKNMTDEEVNSAWSKFSTDDKNAFLRIRFSKNIKSGLFDRIIKLGNPISGDAKPLFDLLTYCENNNILIDTKVSQYLQSYNSIVKELNLCYDGMDLSDTTLVEAIAKALIVRDVLQLDYFKVLKNSTGWKNRHEIATAIDASTCSPEDKLNCNGKELSLAEALATIDKDEALNGNFDSEYLRELAIVKQYIAERREQKIANAPVKAVYDSQIAQLEVQLKTAEANLQSNIKYGGGSAQRQVLYKQIDELKKQINDLKSKSRFM